MNSANNPQQTLQERFPQMRPIKTPPSLFTLNGVGVRLYGKRDFDDGTNTYISTYCFCFLFIPLFAIGAYRVADAERGWYFLGKERLSTFARTWNKIAAAVALWAALQIGWASYTSSESYKTGRDLKAAAKQLEAHEPLKAAATYRGLAGRKSFQDQVRAGLQASLDQCLKSDSAKMVEGAYRILAGLPSSMNQPPIVPDVFASGLASIDRFRARDIEGALGIFDAVSRFNPKETRLAPLRIDLLKQAIAANPGNTNRAVELALIYEENKQLEEAQQLLLPLKDKLGATEGARILGQYLLRQRQNEDAYKLLYPYVQSRLTRLRSVERSYTNSIASVHRRAIGELQDGKAGPDFYSRYKAADKAKQGAMVEDYIRRVMEGDPGYKRALAELQAANKIVHVTLDLGIVQLNRAQGLANAAERKAELEAAEKTFLAIGGLAGDTDEYRLFLGQVYYWLGKSDQGKKLFDELLVSTKRSYTILMALSHTLREVGEYPEARELAEEAFRTAKEPKHRYAAAAFRAHLQIDSADQIAWLKKSDPSDPVIQVELNSALGEKALSDGNKPLAAEYLRKAIAGYESRPNDSSATLNNCGLAYMNLYGVTGDIQDYERGVKLLEQAVDLSPGNSVLLINTLEILYRGALMDCLKGSLPLQDVGESADHSALGFAYEDEPSRAALYEKLAANPRMKKALTYLDKALLLAPKQAALYQLALSIHGSFRDLPELQRLKQRLAAAHLDFSSAEQEMRAFLAGSKDQEYLKQVSGSIQRQEATLASPKAQQHPGLAAYLQAQLNYLSYAASSYGAKPDSRKLLVAARTAYDRSPSAASQSTYASALLFRAHDELLGANADYARVAEPLRRSVGPAHLIPLLLNTGGPVADAIRANENVKAAAALYKERIQKFARFARPVDWAFVRAFDSEAAKVVASQIQTDELTQLQNELELELHPFVGYAVLDNYFMHSAVGNLAKATAVYKDAQKRGVPLPQL